jgi:5-methylcytosine-specific restriction endonuclease McrA
MCVNSIKVKYCEKHNCNYVQRGSSDRMHCRECTNERNRNTVRSQKAKENKREYDRNYGLKKRLDNPDAIKQAQVKYRNSEKGKELINYYKFKFNQGKYCNLYCLECNNVRLYGKKICDQCKVSKRYIAAYNYISKCRHCNVEFGIETKLKNLGNVAQLNNYCSIECNKQSKKITRKRHEKINRHKYKRIKDDKQWARIYGNKYEPISRTIVYRKHNYICTSCGVKCFHPNKDNYNQSNAATLDHIIPKSKGGSHTYDNVTLLCRSCNTIKGDKIVTQFKRNQSQLELQFIDYIPQGLQLQLQMEL